MKESLTDYASALSGSDISVLEDIIENKYLKFRKFFELLRTHTKNIKNLDYVFDEKDVFRASVTFKKKVSLDDKKDMIAAWEATGYSVKYQIKNNVMMIIIKYKE